MSGWWFGRLGDLGQPVDEGDRRRGTTSNSNSLLERSVDLGPVHAAGVLHGSRGTGSEVLCEYALSAARAVVVLALAPLRVPPPAVVLAAGATGLAAAVELARGHLVSAALLVQLKTVLDNADGQLARLPGRTRCSAATSTPSATWSSTPALFAALGSSPAGGSAPSRSLVPDDRARASTTTSSGSTAASAASRPRRCREATGRATASLARLYALAVRAAGPARRAFRRAAAARRGAGGAPRLARPRDGLGRRELRHVDPARGVRALHRSRLSRSRYAWVALAELGPCARRHSRSAASAYPHDRSTRRSETTSTPSSSSSPRSEDAEPTARSRRPTGSATSATSARSSPRRHGSRDARDARDARPLPAGARRCDRAATTATRSSAPRSRASGDRLAAAPSQIVEGPIAFHALCEHHALPFHGVAHVAYIAGAADPRDLEADAARAPLRAAVHGAGAARRADRRHARRAGRAARRRRAPAARRTSAPRCAASRSARGR